MSNIIEFPGKDAQRLRMQKMLNGTITALEIYYTSIDEKMQEICQLEEEVSKVETMYSTLLKEYSKNVEHTRLEARYLAYCKDAQVTWDGDKKCLVFHLPKINEEEEEVE